MRRSSPSCRLWCLAAVPLTLLLSCTAGSSSVPGSSCATTADCAPGTVCTTPTGRCVPIPDNEFIGTFRCYVVDYQQDIPTGDLGASEVEGSYEGTPLDFLAGPRCVSDTVGNLKALFVELEPTPDETGDVTGLLFVLPWPASAPVDVTLGALPGTTRSGALLASPDGGASVAIATATNVGFVHLDQAPSVGQWLSGYVDAPVH